MLRRTHGMRPLPVSMVFLSPSPLCPLSPPSPLTMTCLLPPHPIPRTSPPHASLPVTGWWLDRPLHSTLPPCSLSPLSPPLCPFPHHRQTLSPYTHHLTLPTSPPPLPHHTFAPFHDMALPLHISTNLQHTSTFYPHPHTPPAHTHTRCMHGDGWTCRLDKMGHERHGSFIWFSVPVNRSSYHIMRALNKQKHELLHGRHVTDRKTEGGSRAPTGGFAWFLPSVLLLPSSSCRRARIRRSSCHHYSLPFLLSNGRTGTV